MSFENFTIRRKSGQIKLSKINVSLCNWKCLQTTFRKILQALGNINLRSSHTHLISQNLTTVYHYD